MTKAGCTMFLLLFFGGATGVAVVVVVVVALVVEVVGVEVVVVAFYCYCWCGGFGGWGCGCRCSWFSFPSSLGLDAKVFVTFIFSLRLCVQLLV